MKLFRVSMPMKAIPIMLLLAACTRGGWEVIKDTPPPPPGSKSEFVQIQPDTGTALNIGETVIFKATVRYNVTSPQGMIQMTAQDSQKKQIRGQLFYVGSGPGIKDFELEVKVPHSESITIYSLLMNQYQGSTDIVVSRKFPIHHAR